MLMSHAWVLHGGRRGRDKRDLVESVDTRSVRRDTSCFSCLMSVCTSSVYPERFL